MKTKAAGWSLIKKLIPLAVATEKSKHEIFNEVGNVDLAMRFLHGKIRKSDTKADVQVALDFGIKGLDTGFWRQVPLLNALTP